MRLSCYEKDKCLLLNCRYTSPDIVLLHSNIHLLGVSDGVAYFSVTNQFDNIYETRKFHFLRESTFT